LYNHGSNYYDNPEQEMKFDRTLRSVPIPESVVAAAGGYNFSAAVGQSGKLYLFGDLNYTMYGPMEPRSGITLIPLPGRAVSVVAGYYHVVVLLENGELYGCGNTDGGTLGIVDDVPKRQVIQLKVPERVIQVEAGPGLTLAIGESGKLYGFGAVFLEYGSVVKLPVHIPFSKPVLAVATGFCQIMVTTDPDEVHIFNQNRYCPSVITKDRISPEPTIVSLS